MLISTYANAEQTELERETQLAKNAFCYVYAVSAELQESTVKARAKDVSDWREAQFYFGIASANVVNLAKRFDITEKLAASRLYLKEC